MKLPSQLPKGGLPSRVHPDDVQQHPSGIADSLLTHSIGHRMHPRGIARNLLDSVAPEDRANVEAEYHANAARPLIDRLQEATFGDDVGMQWMTDRHLLRTTLRKAHCFTVDADTSRLVTRFGIAVAGDIDGARLLAVPPFPITWFEIENRARLDEAKNCGLRLTTMASGGEEFGPPVAQVGWLICERGPGEYCATYFSEPLQGMMSSPVSFSWTTKPEPDRVIPHAVRDMMDWLLFGVKETNCHIHGAWFDTAPFQLRRTAPDGSVTIEHFEYEMLAETAGELRHIFGLLVALGAAQLGATTSTADQPLPTTAPPIRKGKPVLPLQHKVLTIKLSRHATVEKITARAITGIKHRWHEVRGHFRTLKNADGTVRKRVPVKAHERGDERIGRVEKTYKVER